MRNFQDLVIWQRGHQITLKIYSITRNYPKEEAFGLTSQMRRSSSSIPTNIAEGCGRNSNPELQRFLVYSSGSSSELEYQLILSRDLGYISEDIYMELSQMVIEVRKMIYSFILSLGK